MCLGRLPACSYCAPTDSPPTGLVSLALIRGPLLGPPHTHLARPPPTLHDAAATAAVGGDGDGDDGQPSSVVRVVRSYFLGDVTSRHVRRKPEMEGRDAVTLTHTPTHPHAFPHMYPSIRKHTNTPTPTPTRLFSHVSIHQETPHDIPQQEQPSAPSRLTTQPPPPPLSHKTNRPTK